MKEDKDMSLGSKYRRKIKRYFEKEIKRAEMSIKNVSESIEEAEKNKSKSRNISEKRALDEQIKLYIRFKKSKKNELRRYEKLLEISIRI